MSERTPSLPPRYYAPIEIAHALNVNVKTVLKWLRDDKLKGKKIGTMWRVSHQDYVEFVEGEYGTEQR